MEVYIPPAVDWYEFNTKLWVPSKGKQEILTKPENIPVYIKAGTILPLKVIALLVIVVFNHL